MTLSNLFTAKQLEVIDDAINNDKWALMINSGAVRAGKTYVDNFIFMLELKRVAKIAMKNGIDNPLYILAGVSSKTIYNNVIIELMNTFGMDFKPDRHNSLSVKFDGLPTVKIIQAYTGSISGLGAIRGMTATGAYINEASMANEEVFAEIRQRCSAEGARVVCDTNPDIPTHWLKKKYIDNPNNSDAITSHHFVLDDNTHLDKKYIKTLKESTPAGMFYDRSILGLWVSGEGVVYRDFDERTMVVGDDQIPDNLTYYAGVDWGYDHLGSIVVIGEAQDGKRYVIEEITAQFKEIDYWVDRARELINKYGKKMPFYADSARPEHVARFINEGFNCSNGFKSVLSGIEVVAKGWKTGTLFVRKGAINKFLDNIYQYIWDEVKGMPVKLNDDVMDALRYAVATHERLANMKKPAPKKQQVKYLTNLGL